MKVAGGRKETDLDSVLLVALAIPSSAAAAETRYSLANGCFALRAPDGKFVAKSEADTRPRGGRGRRESTSACRPRISASTCSMARRRTS